VGGAAAPARVAQDEPALDPEAALPDPPPKAWRRPPRKLVLWGAWLAANSFSRAAIRAWAPFKACSCTRTVCARR
jgi:hypothetical protein